MNLAVPAWWPPKVGTTLRHATHHSADGGLRIKQVNALLHVLTVFENKDGEERIVTAEWFPTKRRWHYETFDAFDAATARIWPDGAQKPQWP